MKELLEFVIRHGYPLIFGWVLIEQAGLPIPSAPLLLAAGALSGTHQINFTLALASALFASMLSDVLWYELGRQEGIRVLQLLCRISLEPDSCVRRAEVVFEKTGARVLLVSKFIPGLNAMVAPLAGTTRMHRRIFLLFDACGALLWAGSFMVIGYAFANELDYIADRAALMGHWLLVLLVAAFVGYVGRKYYNREKFLRGLRIARITPEELKEKLDAGEDLLIVDLRHALEFEAEPDTIRGALHMDAADLEEASEVIPRNREIILFCACPNDVTAAHLALLLRSKGITRIRPLAEGYEGWRRRGFPMGPASDAAHDTEPAKA